ncbi:MAG: malto-oligosyltrehalose trehalohydrolase [Planctomycetota bacterium]
MKDLEVWAPLAKQVEVQTDGERRPLQRKRTGWWTLGAPLAPGTRYAFRLDGSGPFPDPRARSQPEGVHGFSCVDDDAFPWTDAGFQPTPLADAVIYEAHVGTFTPAGTFAAAIERLDALVELGVTHLELLPVAQFSGEHGWGYDGVGLYAAHHAYGGPAGLRRLVDACHARGIAVLLDVVYNHLGPEGNYLPRFGPYFQRKQKTPWGAALNLDGRRSKEVRRYLLDNAAMWLRDFHVDGLRLDAVHALHDESQEHLLTELARETEALSRELGKELLLIAETNRHCPRTIAPRDAGGHGCHAQWCDDLHHALHAHLTGERTGNFAPFGSLATVAEALGRGFTASTYRTPVPQGFPDAAGHRFLGYLQTHDQVGNRAHGERLATLIGYERARAAAALVLCGPFVPMLFQGEEWAATTPWFFFCDHGSPGIQEGVRQGRWRETGEPLGLARADLPDPLAAETVARSRLRWEERAEPEHARMLAWYRDLLRLRRERADLRDGDLGQVKVRFDEAARWLTLCRARTAVALNLGPEPQELPLPELGSEAPRILLASREGAVLGATSVRVPGDAAVVLGLQTTIPRGHDRARLADSRPQCVTPRNRGLAT